MKIGKDRDGKINGDVLRISQHELALIVDSIDHALVYDYFTPPNDKELMGIYDQFEEILAALKSNSQIPLDK